MRIVVFGEEQRVGAWEGDRIVDLNRAFARYLDRRGETNPGQTADARVPSRLEAFIARGPAALEDAQRAIPDAAADGGAVAYAANDVQLHAPWANRRIACVGGNFADHLLGMQANRPAGTTASREQITREAREAGQWGFWKVPDVVAGPDAEIAFPKRTRYLDYEGEAAIVLGKRGKDIPAERIGEYVWGITLLNDWSIRDGMGSTRPMSYNLAKNFDGSTSMGPCIVVGELDPQGVEVETRINGIVRQRFSTRDMIWSFAEVLELLSRDFTFVPGDVIAGGTGAGTAADKTKWLPDGTRPLDLFLKVGDVVELSSPKIGTLRNRVVQA
ncbi:MAG TPA: fumarylacetoacetate hydrolase family protein [Chloroflexota bacterium]|nr:fumarylacetoacetate hydrolase family protein [Chloroflexota bacterium]